jgi:hypothetical protein
MSEFEKEASLQIFLKIKALSCDFKLLCKYGFKPRGLAVMSKKAFGSKRQIAVKSLLTHIEFWD